MRIVLLEELIKGPIRAGSTILVEYDAASKWFVVLANIAARWLKDGGTASYNLTSEPPEAIRSRLSKLGVMVEQFEREDRFRIHDYYTFTLGLKSYEKLAHDSLKVADMSIDFAKTQIRGETIPHVLRCLDNASTMARFNEEKSWIEFMLTRAIPIATLRKSTGIAGIIRGIHTEWAYKQLENAYDCVIDLKLDESVSRVRNELRVRKMRDTDFDSAWHGLKFGENLEASLE